MIKYIAIALLCGCSTSMHKLGRENVGHGIVRYENHEIVCYEFIGLYQDQIKCRFYNDQEKIIIPGIQENYRQLKTAGREF